MKCLLDNITTYDFYTSGDVNGFRGAASNFLNIKIDKITKNE
jgi:hypothetical protein